jgi:hypothetical protein
MGRYITNMAGGQMLADWGKAGEVCHRLAFLGSTLRINIGYSTWVAG